MNKKYIVIIVIVVIIATITYYFYRKKSNYESKQLKGSGTYANMQLFDRYGKIISNSNIVIVKNGISKSIMSNTTGFISVPGHFIGLSIDIYAYINRYPSKHLEVYSASSVIVKNGKKVKLH